MQRAKSMPQKGLQGRKLHLLSTKKVEQIHKTSLRILEEVGVSVKDERYLNLFRRVGASVDRSKQTVRLPSVLVNDLVSLAPSQFLMAGRKREHDMQIGDRHVHLGSGGATVRVLDLDSGHLRPSTLQDQYDLAWLVEHLDNVHFYQCPVACNDVPADIVTINSFYAALAGTTKNVQDSATNPQAVKDVITMAAMIAGSRETLRMRPFISFVTSCMISPLQLDTKVVRVLETVLKDGIPVALSSAPVTGLSAPATLAGLLSLVHAEQLFAIALSQIIAPGARVLYGAVPGVADMWNMGFLGGAIEAGMMNAAAVLLAKHIKVPIYSDAGGADAKLPDIQAGYEKALSILQVSLSGGDYIHHSAGVLDSLMTVAYEQFVIDNDINGMAMRVLQGIEVNDDTLAFDVIKEVGPCGRFFTHKHTLKYARSDEFYVPTGLTRKHLRARNGEADDVREGARQIAREILDKERIALIPQNIDRKIRRRFDIRLPLPHRSTTTTKQKAAVRPSPEA
jgi:trimethylamine--corrinoid protein Co-methyltransferase